MSLLFIEKLPIAGLLGAITKVIQVGPNFYEFFSTVINTLLSLPLEEEAFQKLRGLVHFGVSRVVHSCGPNDAMKIVRSFLEKVRENEREGEGLGKEIRKNEEIS